MATPSPAPSPAAATGLPAGLPARIVFFDGICGFCDGAVRWLIEHDPQARLHFAPLQGETAARVQARFPERFPTDVDTLVYLRPSRRNGEPELLLRSAALFELLDEVGGAWHWLVALRVLPRALTDLAYRAFAACRYRLFGRIDACSIPSAGDRARLLP